MTTTPNSGLQSSKLAIRERVWDLLQARRAVPAPDIHGRIPDFNGATEAAARLASLPAWENAQVVKAVPTRPSCRFVRDVSESRGARYVGCERGLRAFEKC